jgi:membrane associated rhomboid family serine protease
LVVLNVVSFIAQQAYPRYTAWGVKLSERIMNGKDLYRLASPVFLHGDLWHIAMNMYSLQNVGPIAERYFGPGRFIMSYLTAGIAGNLLSAMMSPNPALGASGAIFGVSGMILVFLQRNEWLFGRQGEAMQSSVVQNIGINLFYGFMNPRVDNWGHLGGAIGGAMAAYYFGPRLYLAPLPGTESVTVVDKPILRLPRWVESLPEKASNRARRLVRRMQVWQFTDNLPSRPWRTGGSGDRLKRTDYKRRQINTPNQSIKPNIEE